MNFLEEFRNRGYFHQCTNEDELFRLCNKDKITAYIGFDCTATSLHVGSLMQIMILRLLQKHGHKPIILIGGATTKIGDPTLKDTVRKYLSDDEIKKNMEGIKYSLSKFIKFGEGASDAIMLNNSDWLEKIGYIEFLRDMGRMFSINKMLTMDSVKLRLEREQSLTFLEFNYMLLQAYDFMHLNQNFNCKLQLGGSDQWGNIVTGIDLARKVNNAQLYGLTTPLLTTSSGAKMGKSEKGAIWLNEDLLSPYDYYQYWRNIEDNDVIKFANLFCEFTDKELIDFEELAKNNINEAKKLLALTVTSLCHGHDNASVAQEISVNIFEKGQIDQNLPIFEIDRSLIKAGLAASELFFSSGLVASKGEAKRLIKGQGARINDEIVSDENYQISEQDILDGSLIKLSYGKKKHILVKLY